MTTAVIIKTDSTEPVLHNPFYPDFKSSTPLNASPEQLMYINEILDIVCSDSQFKKKAINGILYILNAGLPLPTVTSLVPSTVVLGEPSFQLHVKGTNFTEESIIVFNGFDEPTTYISPTELTTGVNMPLWQAPAVVPISVKNAEGTVSNSMDFSFTAPALQSMRVPGAPEVSKVAEVKKPEPVKPAVATTSTTIVKK